MSNTRLLLILRSTPFSTYVWGAFVVLLIIYVGWIIYATCFHSLRNIPGPFLARISRFWITWHIIRGDMEKEQRKLHAKYGSLVRIAPNEVACASPESKDIIYPMKAALAKSDFYSMWQNPSIGNFPDHFSQRDERVHAERRRIVSHIYSLANILQSEEHIDKCSNLFMQRMGEFADAGTVVDLGEWLQMYAFDVVGELFFGQMFGFIRDSEDHESYIASLDILLPFLTTISVIPSYLRIMVAMSGLLIPSIRRAFGALATIEGAAKGCVAKRSEILRTTDKIQVRRDLLQQMFTIQEQKGADINFGEKDMAKEAYSAIFAGSDTTAIAIRASLYYVMTTPTVYDELMAEIDTAVNNNTINHQGAISYAQAIKMPYLCATIKEAMRLHPSVGLTLPREVPESGLWVEDTFIAPGNLIGMNAAVVQYDRNIFGEDSYSFRPSRWLSEDTAQMNRCMLHFGAGTRTCLGKNISLAELHKLIPQILRDFRLSLVSPHPWKTSNFFFNKQTGIDVRLYRRDVVRNEFPHQQS